MWLTRYLSLQDSQDFTLKYSRIQEQNIQDYNMAQRGDRYFTLVRSINLPKKFAQNVRYETIAYQLPISITIEDQDDERKFTPYTTYSEKLYKLRQDEEDEYFSEYIIEEKNEKIGCITEEELTNIFLNIFYLLTALYIIPPILRVYKGSTIMVIPKYTNETITFVINISFLFAPYTYFGRIRDFIEFIKFVDRPTNRWFSYCGRCTNLYSVGALGCPCLQEESSGDEGYDTD